MLLLTTCFLYTNCKFEHKSKALSELILL